MSRTRVGVLVAGGAIAAFAFIPEVVRAGHENTVLSASLSGAAEVGDDGSIGVGDPDGAGTAYVFGIDGDPTTLCYLITATGIDPSFEPGEVGMAHIHRGAEGANGPVVAALAFPLEGDAGDCLTEGEEDKFPLIGEAGEPASIVADILANPANYYVNVHTGEFPAGAIRGQLVDVHDGAGDHAMTESSAPASVPATEPPAEGMAAATEVSVEISDFSFVAPEVRVAVGGTVTWTNNDAQQHTATSAGGFNTGTIEPGASVSVTFDAAGTFEYACAFHPFMKGTVIVG
jgi:plastocyanin